MPLVFPDSRDIHDAAARGHVICLQKEFSDQPWETCYYWYLYHHRDYETTKARFANGLSKPTQITASCPVTKRLGTERVDLGAFPAEIWQIISTHLTFHDLSKLRLTNSALADIAAESMVRTIRFDLSFESLERLRSIAAHEHLRIGVKYLTFEADLLGSAGCIHSYSAHYDLEHHKDYKPQLPPEDQRTPQAQRLHTRNLAKFNKDLENKYAEYRKSFEAQARLRMGPKEHLFECIDRFPNLQGITLATEQCRHLLSERFAERHLQDCAVPLAVDSSQTPWQLRNILRPGIKSLSARQISPKFFDEEKEGCSKSWLQSIFQNLEFISLHFRQDGRIGLQALNPLLKSANLSHAIGCAKELKRLSVNFTAIVPVGNLSDIIPEGHSYSELYSLTIGSFVATEKDLMKMLKMQPALKSLELSDVKLSIGEWRSLLKCMRDGLSLNSFTVEGILEDATVELFTDMFCIMAWQDGYGMPLSSVIEIYVTEPAALRGTDDYDEDFDEYWNPVSRVEDGDFAPYEELLESLGPLDDSDLEDDLDDDLEGDLDDDLDDEISDSDNDENISGDSDDESMYTANEAMSDNGEDTKEADSSNTDMDDLPDLVDIPALPMDVD